MDKFEILITDSKKDENRQQMAWSNHDKVIYFQVYNLNECPEDAIIGRDLFDVHDFIEAVQLGFRIAKRGYDEIVVKEIPYDQIEF